MIERYTRPQMGAIWSDQNKFRIWLEIELLAVEAHVQLGIVPREDYEELRAKAGFSIERIAEIERTTKHDVIAFLTCVAEQVASPVSRWLHMGMTSSDVLDTCLAVQLKQAGELIIEGLERLREVLARRAREHRTTLCVGRTHGVHAEPMVFGLKFLLYHEECKRNIERMRRAIETIAVGKISGAIGTFEHLDPRVEEYVCAKLGLRPDPITTQVIQRDRHAEYMATLAIIASSLEKIALEVRHLQRTEVREAEEYFSAGQKGSSAMPHKRNPIHSERICGLARLLRSYAQAAFENNALWHERDISHSSVERVIFPDATIALDYMIAQTTELVETLVVYPERMRQTIEQSHGLVFSQAVLLELVRRGMTREQAYSLVQAAAMRSWDENRHLRETLSEDSTVSTYISADELDAIFRGERSLSNISYLYRRCGLE
ncbi:MAG: adenylosuccinate lyase [Bacteroidota bacterium]|nr:adenylosuccinate lyase [Candidatus Kapabacteria bacterium]MCS7303298.1 adenylosuccinate lyase [Candidatus Kapabacteria bacterium]MDW8074733.1 adenylosuccinate lyase [Bacteroidota bacterium]MDW8270791.1 adenylosuccinate lyase [Bacteroidota bacterium]